MSPYQQIIELLESNKVKYELEEHEPVTTLEDTLRVTDHKPEHAAKALLLKVGDKFILCVVRGDNKLDYKKVKQIFKSRKARFARPEEVKKITGVEIGAVYPFGNIMGIDWLVDDSFKDNKLITFSPGKHDSHIKMSWKDYYNLLKPKLSDISA